jgi:hypothetical protein
MLSTPTKQPPLPPYPPAPEQERAPEAATEKKIAMTPSRRRLGQTPLALVVKAILRPIFKALYYLIRAIRTHKLVSLIALILLVASIMLTNYFTTGTTPFSSSSANSVQENVQGTSTVPASVQNWLVALRTGDLNSMEALQKTIPSTQVSPDAAAYILLYSEKYGGVTWTNLNITGSQAADKTEDIYVEIDMTAPATTAGAAPAKLIVLWHFTTIPQLNNSIFRIDFISVRQSQS